MPDIKRLNYFNSQFLVEKDFRDEQAYHLAMRRQNLLALHGWGVVSGFDVSWPGSAGTILNVAPGLAIDSAGREIMLAATAIIDPAAVPIGARFWLTVAYQERFDAADAQVLGVETKYTRVTEGTALAWTQTEPAYDGAVIVLAQVTKLIVPGGGAQSFTYSIIVPPKRGAAGKGVQPSSSLTVRNIRVSGIVDIPPSDTGSALHAPLRVSGRLVIDPNEALAGDDGSGALSIYSTHRDTGFHFKVTADSDYSRQLGISAGNAPGQNPDNMTLRANGNVGIQNSNPRGALQIGSPSTLPAPSVFLVGDTTRNEDGLRIHYNSDNRVRGGVIDVKGSFFSLRGESAYLSDVQGNSVSGSTNRLYVNMNNGFVGINTSDPKFQLHVYGTIKVVGDIQCTGTVYQKVALN